MRNAFNNISNGKQSGLSPVAETGLVKAPVIADASEQGAREFLGFIDKLAASDNIATAAEESLRLDPYFKLMDDDFAATMSAGQKNEFKTITSKNGLCALFNDMAKVTRNTFISDVAVLHGGIGSVNAATAVITAHRDEYMITFKYGRTVTKFGFHNVIHRDCGILKGGSTAFPLFLVDGKQIDSLPPEAAAPLLSDFQHVMTAVNHDPMHHFSILSIDGVAPRLNAAIDDTNAMTEWFKTIPKIEDYGRPYEELAQRKHQDYVLNARNSSLADAIQSNVRNYFDKIDDIAVTMRENGTAPQDISDTIDYFNTLMCHALLRVFPFGHPVMTEALHRAETADPQANILGLRLIESLTEMSIAKKETAIAADTRTRIRDGIDTLHKDIKFKIDAIIATYDDAQHDLLESTSPVISYASIKTLQLCLMSPDDVLSHMPLNNSNPLKEMHDSQEQLILGMVTAAARIIDSYKR